MRYFGIAVVIVQAVTKQTNGFQISQLLSTCVFACERGCLAIRTVQASRESAGSGDTFKVELKDKNDPRSALTEADHAAHIAITASLRKTWDASSETLNIVCEEDDGNCEDAVLAYMNDVNNLPLPKDLLDDDIGETTDIDASDITIFVDPLDGTREFVEGRLSNCQVLVGIAVGGEAIAGAIGIPFPSDDMNTEPTIVYGIADFGTGVKGSPLTRGPFPLDRHIDGLRFPRPHYATGDSNAPVMTACKKAAIKRYGGSNVIYGGAGNKILAAALGEVACSIQHKIGGPWDLCAPEAILKAMGGRMTDIFGEDIAIYRDDAPLRCNERGYIASQPGSEEYFHDALVAAFKALPEMEEYQKSLE